MYICFRQLIDLLIWTLSQICDVYSHVVLINKNNSFSVDFCLFCLDKCCVRDRLSQRLFRFHFIKYFVVCQYPFVANSLNNKQCPVINMTYWRSWGPEFEVWSFISIQSNLYCFSGSLSCRSRIIKSESKEKYLNGQTHSFSV